MWFEDDTAVTIEIHDAVPADGDVIGEPDAVVESDFGPAHRRAIVPRARPTAAVDEERLLAAWTQLYRPTLENPE